MLNNNNLKATGPDAPGQPLDYVLLVLFFLFFIPTLAASIYSLLISRSYAPVRSTQTKLYFLVVFGGMIRAGSSLISFGHFFWNSLPCNLWVYWGSTIGVGIYLGSMATRLNITHRVLRKKRAPFSISSMGVLACYLLPWIPYAIFGTVMFPYEFDVANQKCVVKDIGVQPEWFSAIGALLGLGVIIIIIVFGFRLRTVRSEYRQSSVLMFHSILIFSGTIVIAIVNFFIINTSFLGRFLTSLPPIIIPNLIFWTGVGKPLYHGMKKNKSYEELFLRNLTTNEIIITGGSLDEYLTDQRVVSSLKEYATRYHNEEIMLFLEKLMERNDIFSGLVQGSIGKLTKEMIVTFLVRGCDQELNMPHDVLEEFSKYNEELSNNNIENLPKDHFLLKQDLFERVKLEISMIISGDFLTNYLISKEFKELKDKTKTNKHLKDAEMV